MSQFKPMTKMKTTEPSVILKLKKGGKVASKAAGSADSFKSMAHSGTKMFDDSESGMAPKKPSMAERRRSMNPNLYAKGGKVAHKQMGGGMPMPAGASMAAPVAAPPAAPMRPVDRAAANPRARRAAMAKRAMTGMKDGGSSDCKTVEKELKQHESKSASAAHGKASGGIIMSKSGKTKMDTAKKGKTSGSTGEVKEGKPGGYKSGGGVKMGNAGGFKEGGSCDWENRPANSSKPGVKNTTTGGVKKANAGGYKEGGQAKKAYATGGTVDTGKPVAMPKRPVSRPIANSLQSGTFAKGGKVEKFSSGGDASKGAYDKSIGPDESDMEMAKSIRAVPRKLYGMAKDGFKSLTGMGSKPPKGSVTKTEESVTVTPRKRGGAC